MKVHRCSEMYWANLMHARISKDITHPSSCAASTTAVMALSMPIVGWSLDFSLFPFDGLALHCSGVWRTHLPSIWWFGHQWYTFPSWILVVLPFVGLTRYHGVCSLELEEPVVGLSLPFFFFLLDLFPSSPLFPAFPLSAFVFSWALRELMVDLSAMISESCCEGTCHSLRLTRFRCWMMSEMVIY